MSVVSYCRAFPFLTQHSTFVSQNHIQGKRFSSRSFIRQYKEEQQTHLFPCLSLLDSPPPLSILQAVCRSPWLLKLLSTVASKCCRSWKTSYPWSSLSLNLGAALKEKNPKVKESVFNDRCTTENFPHKVLMLWNINSLKSQKGNDLHSWKMKPLAAFSSSIF